MQEAIFWEYIDLINHVDTEISDTREKEYYQVILIKQKLVELEFREILNFHRIFSEKLYELFLPTLAEVFMISFNSYDKLKDGNIYIPNDGFRDFRSWIIGLGKEEFHNFKSYTREKDFLKYDLNPENAYRDDLEYIAADVYEIFKNKAENPKQVEMIYQKKYEYKSDGNYDLDLNDKIDWANIDKKYPTLLKKT